MHGYTTFGVASNQHLSEEFGFSRGFDYFRSLSFLPAPSVSEAIASWEEEIKKSDKFFLWVHYFDPHWPYSPRTPWIEDYTSKTLAEELIVPEKWWSVLLSSASTSNKDPQALSTRIALYDSEINYVDSFIGKLIHKFELDQNTLIVITSDHGEEFLEHGHLAHGKNLHQETINIPLIIKLPHSSKKNTFEKPISLIDIMPTILHTINANSPEQTLGEPFLEVDNSLQWVVGGLLKNKRDYYTFSELDRNFSFKAIVTPEWKYIYNYMDKTGQLFNLKSDPSEKINLVDSNVMQVSKLREELFNWVSNARKYPVRSQSFELSQKEKERLEAMGYLDTQEIKVVR